MESAAPALPETAPLLDIKPMSDTSFSITYRGCYWFLEYDADAEFEHWDADELIPGEWHLHRDPRRREPPPTYTFTARAPHYHISAATPFMMDVGTALTIIEQDFDKFAAERKGMHHRKKARDE